MMDERRRNPASQKRIRVRRFFRDRRSACVRLQTLRVLFSRPPYGPQTIQEKRSRCFFGVFGRKRATNLEVRRLLALLQGERRERQLRQQESQCQRELRGRSRLPREVSAEKKENFDCLGRSFLSEGFSTIRRASALFPGSWTAV